MLPSIAKNLRACRAPDHRLLWRAAFLLTECGERRAESEEPTESRERRANRGRGEFRSSLPALRLFPARQAGAMRSGGRPYRAPVRRDHHEEAPTIVAQGAGG